MSRTVVDLTIIGGGVVGLSLARLFAAQGGPEVVIVERNTSFRGENQSSRNSGVIHAGIYHDPAHAPLKARLCVEGNTLLQAYCRQADVPHRMVGKLVVATNDYDFEILDELVRVARANGVPRIETLDAAGLAAREPGVHGIGALWFPTSGIVEATALVTALARDATAQGAIMLASTEVVDVESIGSHLRVHTITNGRSETIETKQLINAAGLYSDRVAKMIDPDWDVEIEPVRGEFARFNPSVRPDLHVPACNVYQAPHAYCNATGEKLSMALAEARALVASGAASMTVGAHLTPTFDSTNLSIGPLKTVAHARDDYSEGLRPEADYLRAISGFFPHLRESDIQLYQTGIMAVPRGRRDWIIEPSRRQPNMINLVGIDSPGLTGALAIAEHVRSMIETSPAA